MRSILIASNLLVSVVSAIWPVPIKSSTGNITVVLADGFTIEFNAPTGSMPSGCVDTWSKVNSAINRTYGLLEDGFVPKMLYMFEEDFEPTTATMGSAQKLSKLVVTQKYGPKLSLIKVFRSFFDTESGQS
jgi:hypothetical protein